MPLDRYRAVLRAPGVFGLLFVGFIARGPVIAVSAVLTLHVVLTLHMSYGSAGVLVTVLTVSTAAGAPWRGRVIDRLGLRRALVPAIVLGGGVWLIAPFVNYAGLVVVSVVGGVFGLPAFAVIRQALVVAVGKEHRRATLALDSVSVEVSFMTGPALAVLAATTWSTRGVLLVVGAAQLLAGSALWLLNPPVRSASHDQEDARPEVVEPPDVDPASRAAQDRRHGRHRRSAAWLTVPLLAVFATGTGAALVLAGSEVAVVAQLRHLGHASFISVVFVIWGITSIVGGFVYGALHRELPPPLVLIGLAVLTLPIGLASGPLGVAVLIGVAGLFCAPVLTATSTAVSHLAPEESRGEAMGWQGTAMTIGSGIGAPLAGFAADRWGAHGAYLAAGAAGIVLALVAGALTTGVAGRRPEPPPRNTGVRVAADTLTD